MSILRGVWGIISWVRAFPDDEWDEVDLERGGVGLGWKCRLILSSTRAMRPVEIMTLNLILDLIW